MTSALHSVIVDVIEAHPAALAYLLGLQGAAPEGELVPTTGTRTKTFTLERRVDRAFLIGSKKAPEGFLLAEAQLSPDEDKRFSWALYFELARSRYRCEGALVAITVSQAVRDWIDRRIRPKTGRYGSSRQIEPTVIALDRIDPKLLLLPERPYLAQLAVAGHAEKPQAKQVAEAAVDMTMDVLPKPLATEQLDAILGMVDDALRAQLEKRIMERHEYRSELFRNIYEKGAAEGEAKGAAEGKAKGAAEGEARAILRVLAARGIPISAGIRKTILACTDQATLDRWIDRAAFAGTAAELVQAPAPVRRAAKRTARKTGKSA